MSRPVPRKHLVGATALLGILVVTVAYLYSNVLGSSLTDKPVHVTVELRETGGLFAGSGVTYRGVKVGTVDDVATAGNHIAATVTLDPSVRVPAATLAVVRSLSPAGEQYLDLQPPAAEAPWLRDGATIPIDKTATPTTIATALRAIDSLMSQVDEDDLTTVLDELQHAFADPEDLGRVISSGSNIIDTLDTAWPQTLRTLENGRTVLRTGVDTSDQFVEFTGSLKSLTASLEDYDPELRGILARTPAQVQEFRTLTSLMALKLPPLLTRMTDLTGLLADRDPHLRALLQEFPKGLDRLGDTIQRGSLQVNMLVSPGDVCSYGVDQASPRSTTRRPVVTGRSCRADFPGQQRGAAHVPAVR